MRPLHRIAEQLIFQCKVLRFCILGARSRCSNRARNHKITVEVPMNAKYSSPTTPSQREEELQAPSSRLQDEKISDDSGTEAKAPNSALAPAGLKNPFWK